ncbi:hypothetical protein ES703_115577 [subsurface metagenome]
MVKCEICGQEFKNKAGLAGHIKFAHPDSVQVPSAELQAAMERTEELVIGIAKHLEDLGRVLAEAVMKPEQLEQLVASAVLGAKAGNPGNPGKEAVKEPVKERWGFKPEPEPEPEPNPKPKPKERTIPGSIFKQS